MKSLEPFAIFGTLDALPDAFPDALFVEHIAVAFSYVFSCVHGAEPILFQQDIETLSLHLIACARASKNFPWMNSLNPL